MKRLNNEGMLISLKLGTIFISHIVLFYALNDLYLFFIANPDLANTYLGPFQVGRPAYVYYSKECSSERFTNTKA